MDEDERPAPLPPLPPLEPPTPGPDDGGGRQRTALRVVLVLLVLGGLATAVLITGRDDEGGPDAGAALARSQAFVRDATSFRFTMQGALRSDEDTSDDEGTGHGEWSDGRWRMVTEDASEADEFVVDDATFYSRSADTAAELESARWTSEPNPAPTHEELLAHLEESGQADDEESLASTTITVAVYGCLGGGSQAVAGFGLDPVAFLTGVQHMASPTVVPDTDATVTLAADLDVPDDFVEAFGHPIPRCAVELDLDAADRPTALRLDTASGDASLSFEFAFTDWNAPIDIAVPSPDEVDDVADEDVADEDVAGDVRDLRSLVPVFPTSLPDGWEVAIVDVSPAQDLYDPTDVPLPDSCEALTIEVYGNGSSDEDSYLSIAELTSECALLAYDTPFEPGGPGGLPVRELDLGGVQYRYGDTVVEVYSSLDRAEQDAIFASLAPIDIDALVDMATL